MPRARVRYVMIGTCPKCGAEFIRPPPCDVAACTCESVIEVPLKPFLILPARMYNKFQKIADRAGVSLEALINAIFEFAVENPKVLEHGMS